MGYAGLILTTACLAKAILPVAIAVIAVQDAATYAVTRLALGLTAQALLQSTWLYPQIMRLNCPTRLAMILPLFLTLSVTRCIRPLVSTLLVKTYLLPAPARLALWQQLSH